MEDDGQDLCTISPTELFSDAVMPAFDAGKSEVKGLIRFADGAESELRITKKASAGAANPSPLPSPVAVDFAAASSSAPLPAAAPAAPAPAAAANVLELLNDAFELGDVVMAPATAGSAAPPAAAPAAAPASGVANATGGAGPAPAPVSAPVVASAAAAPKPDPEPKFPEKTVNVNLMHNGFRVLSRSISSSTRGRDLLTALLPQPQVAPNDASSPTTHLIFTQAGRLIPDGAL